MLFEALKVLFPGISPVVDVVLQDDGEGPYISQWNRAEPQPTPEEIEAAFQLVEATRLRDSKVAVMADFKARREVYLNRLTGIAGRMTRAGLNEVATAADTFAQGLLDLPDLPSVVSAQDGNALKVAIMIQYKTLAAAASATPGADTAFDKVSA